MGFFIRPKDTNRVEDGDTSKMNAEAIGVVSEYEDEYTSKTGVADHHRDPTRREAEPGSPLPTGGGGRTAVSRNVPSGFGRGTRAGRTGRRG